VRTASPRGSRHEGEITLPARLLSDYSRSSITGRRSSSANPKTHKVHLACGR